MKNLLLVLFFILSFFLVLGFTDKSFANNSRLCSDYQAVVFPAPLAPVPLPPTDYLIRACINDINGRIYASADWGGSTNSHFATVKINDLKSNKTVFTSSVFLSPIGNIADGDKNFSVPIISGHKYQVYIYDKTNSLGALSPEESVGFIPCQSTGQDKFRCGAHSNKSLIYSYFNQSIKIHGKGNYR